MARLIFALPASKGFLLAGGAGLLARMVIGSAGEGVLIDTAVNAPPDLPASATSAGPTLAPEELAGHKLLALFDRAAARDFADVYVLARRFGKDVMLARAAQVDAGFDCNVLADMIATLDRLGDDELPLPEGASASELRAFYAAWRSELLPALLADFSRPRACRGDQPESTSVYPNGPSERLSWAGR